ncbi:MAG: hypothetical protein ACTSR8_08280 [Promethearchaeota archaeon]
MSENPERKRRRPDLYKKEDKDEDVLKKLKEVRQNLQESLDETPEKKGPSLTRKRGERRLYKKDEDKQPIAPIISKGPGKKQVSAKRLAAVQKRVKAKVEESKGISKKRKALIIIWMIIMSVPLFFINTIAALGVEIDFGGFGLLYNENKPGTIILSFPARNPSFMPMHLSQFEINLYTDDGEYIGKATNNDELNIMPYQTERLYITLALEEDTGGKWISDWLTTMVIKLRIGSMVYNGMEVDTSFLPPIEIDTSDILRDMITGLLDIEELVNGLDLGEMLQGEQTAIAGMYGASYGPQPSKIKLDPYSNARKKRIFEDLMTGQIGDMEDMTLNVSFGMSENDEEFMLGLGATINLKDLVSTEDLGGIVLGPIYMDNLDVQLRISTTKKYTDKREIDDDDEWYKNYEYTIAQLTTSKENQIFIADTKGRDSVIGLNMSIKKDDPALIAQNGGIHPSANITSWDENNQTDPLSIYHFLRGSGAFSSLMNGKPAWQMFPCWYFLYNFLGRGALDCGIAIENVDINIFGLQIDDVSLSMEILPPLFFDEGVLDPDNFMRLAPDYGIAGMLKHFAKGITEGPARALLGIPPQPETNDEELTEYGIPPEKDIDTLLDDFVEMIEFPDINFDDIEETWGDNAKLHIGLPISLNNSMLNFYCGFTNMKVSIASTIGEVSQEFLTLSVKGNGSDTVYIPGISNKLIGLEIAVDIYKNASVAPFAVKFLSEMIENFTINGIITASFERLVLFKENYTYGPFEIAIPLTIDMESIAVGLIESLVPSIVGGLLDLGGEENATQTSAIPMTPITMFTGVHQMPALLRILQNVPLIQQYAAQEEGTEEPDAFSEMINGIINDIVGSLTGGLLGSEMEFTLGLDVKIYESQRTEMTIRLDDFFVDDFFITLGMGETNLNLKSKNIDGKWENLVGIKVDNYFEIKEGVREDIEVTIIIYETDALCNFLTTFVNEFFTENLTNVVDLKIAGYTTVNLSGLYMEDLDISFTLEELDTGLNGTDMIDDVFDMIYDVELDDKPQNPELLDLWAGPINQIPFISQGIDLETLFHMGVINILSMSETHFNESTNGVAEIVLSMEDVINYMMSIDILKMDVTIFDKDPTDPLITDEVKMVEISVSDGSGLNYGTKGDLNISITIYKEEKTKEWLEYVINNLALDGFVNFSASLKIFGCTIDIEPTYLPAINLTRLPIDITEIFATLFNPFAAPFMNLMGPRMSQDININSIFENVLQFSIGGISIGDYTPVGPLNYDTSMLDVGVNLWLEPKFNMSINGFKLQLLDGGLYQALHVNGGYDFLDVAKEATIAQIILDPAHNGYVPFNSCIPYTLQNDPLKPYLINKSAAVWDVNESKWIVEDGVKFELSKTKLESAGYNTFKNITEFNANETEGGGFDYNTVALALGCKALNNLSIKVELFNKSHGTWDTRYKRKYWRALGGPYFPAQRYGKEYGGYPDHYYVYHPYYAPLVSLIQKALALLDESGIATNEDAVTEMIRGIAIAGMVNITIFSMDLSINLNNPRINAMFEPVSSLFLGTAAIALKNLVKKVGSPLETAVQHPTAAKMETLMMAQGIEEIFGDLMDMSSIPLDINDIMVGLTFPGILNRPNHDYSPQTQDVYGASRCWDGSEQWDKDMYYNIDPEKLRGSGWNYEGSLDDPFFTGESYGNGIPKEVFVKDAGYNWFKQVCQNWANDMHVLNPYFETNYSLRGDYQGGSLIEEPKKWPLLYSKTAFGGRCRTATLVFHISTLLTMPVGVLAGKMSLWMENPYEPCQFMPFGYTWINESVRIKPIYKILDDPEVDPAQGGHLDEFLNQTNSNTTYAQIKACYEENGTLGWRTEDADAATLALAQCGSNGSVYGFTENGKPNSPGWVIALNLRFFEGIPSSQFFKELISGGFNIFLMAQGFLNFSVFGYEFYNLFLPNDIAKMGNPTKFAARCGYFGGGVNSGGYGQWGIPDSTGSITEPDDVEEEEEEYWPHYLLEPPKMEFAFSLPLDTIFAAFTDFGSLFSDLSSGVDIGIVGLEYLRLSIDLPLPNPVPIAAHITEVKIILLLAKTTDPYNYNWQIGGDWTIIATSLLPDEDYSAIPLMDLSNCGTAGGFNPKDAYDFRFNPYKGWHTPHLLNLGVVADVPIDIDEVIAQGYLRMEFFSGGIVTVYFADNVWLKIAAIDIDFSIPDAFGQELRLYIEDLDAVMAEPIDLSGTELIAL